jgi:DNA mismatch repair protein MutS2
VNASVGFDLAAMSPTFKVAMGVPGPSSALAVARRFGVPETVLERAEGFLSREAVSFDEMVEKLRAERRALELARHDAEREAESLRAKQAELDTELARLAEKDRRFISKETEALAESLKKARAELRDAQARMKSPDATEADLKQVARALSAVAQKTSIGGELEPPRGREGEPERAPLPANALRVGARVYVPKLRAEAQVVEIMGRGLVRVAAGPLTLTTEASELRSSVIRVGAAPPDAPKPQSAVRNPRGEPPGQRWDFDAAADPDVPIQTTDNTVDLRGMRADDAVAMAEQFLDRCIGSGRRVAFLIHGHGTGALREAVRAALKVSAYVAKSRAGGMGEGGDGVTVAWLK